jgi:hypothetical protein
MLVDKRIKILDLLIIFVSIFSIGHLTVYFTLHPDLYILSDFHIRLEAARGNYSSLFWYKHYLAVLWKPLLLFSNEMTALFVYESILTIFMLLLNHKMCEVEYGWILVLASMSIYKDTLQNGNPAIILAYLVCFPKASLLAILVKPYYFIFVILHTFTASIKGCFSKYTYKTAKSIPLVANLLYSYERKKK